MAFELFDSDGELYVREGNLPHWYQPGVTYFVTFRTADSVPQELLRSWYARDACCCGARGIDPASAAWRSVLSSQPDLDIEYHKIFTRQFMEYLDQGYGDCALRRPDLARIVAENLEHFDNDRYHLGDFVVMPNIPCAWWCWCGVSAPEGLMWWCSAAPAAAPLHVVLRSVTYCSITDDSNAAMRELRQASKDDPEGTMKKIAEHRKETLSKIVAKLNDEQQKTWKEMIGAPFELKIEFRPRNN